MHQIHPSDTPGTPEQHTLHTRTDLDARRPHDWTPLPSDSLDLVDLVTATPPCPLSMARIWTRAPPRTGPPSAMRALAGSTASPTRRVSIQRTCSRYTIVYLVLYLLPGVLSASLPLMAQEDP
eukprot:4958883-Pyramimonas_sp.AAC.1